MSTASSRRIAVVSGGSSGIGLATVTELLQRGFRVGFFGQNPDHVRRAEDGLLARFPASDVLACTVDLCAPEEIAAFFAEIRNLFGMPDTLVCCAGISPKGDNGAVPFSDIALDEWNEVMAVNLSGAMLCAQHVLPSMMAQKFGRLVLIGSVAGRSVPKVAGASYAASKAGLTGLLHALVAAIAGSGVTANLIAPGRILTDMAGPESAPQNQAARLRIPVGRLGRPLDIAACVAFLTSSNAGFINGAIIDVNGGEFSPP